MRNVLPLDSRRQLLAFVGGVVFVSRGVIYALGVRFYDQEVDRYMPFLDVDLLRTDLIQSVWCLHLKPPIMNLGTGFVLQSAADASTLVLALLFGALGILLALSLADVLCQMGIPHWLVSILSIGYAISPSVLLFENFLYHTYPAAALVTTTAACFGRALSTGRLRWWGACFGVGMGLCYTRSLYHLVWLLGLLVLALVLQWGHRRRILRAAALPTLGVVALYAKNLAIFGFFGASSWLGLSLAKGTVDQLPTSTKAAWIKNDRLTPVAQVDPFAGPSAYQSHVDTPPPTDIPALDRWQKSSGAPNYNHRIYPRASRLQLWNGLTTIRHRPLLYAKTVLRDLVHWVSPTTTWHPRDPEGSPFRDNRSVLGSYERAVHALVYPFKPGDRVGLPLLIPIILLVGSTWGLRDVHRDQVVQGGLRLFIAGTGLYVAAVSCLVESGPELSRFRFTVNALLLALVASIVLDWLSADSSST